MKPTLDTSEHPIVIATYAKALTIEGMYEYLDELEKVYQGDRFAMIVDCRQLDALIATPDYTQVVSQRINALREKYPNRIVSEALVADAFVVRGLFRVYAWFKTTKDFPSQICKDLAEARTFSREQLQQAGCLAPTP